MGAIWGFTGSRDERLAEGMTAALSHRGDVQVDSLAGRDGSLYRRAPHRPWCVGDVEPGLADFPELDLSLGMCGWLHDPRAAESSANDDFYARLAHAYRSEGLAAIEGFRGAYILCLRDGPRIHLVRDGAGNRTVYYGRMGPRWLFGVEPKAITTAPGFEKRILPASLAQYLACSFVPGSATMLADLFELKAGHTVTLQAGEQPLVRRWFRFEDHEPAAGQSVGREHAEQVELDREDVGGAVRRFRRDLAQAVEERLPRGEPVGVFLSGGLDSSVITAELTRQLGGRNVRTWAIHFGERYHHELDFARAVAERCGTIHEEVLIKPRHFIPRLRKMVWHLDDPIGDPITQPNFELAAHASQEVGFVFNGEGGDPCFGGPKNIPMMIHHWYGGLQRGPNFRERHYLESYRRAWDEINLLLSSDIRRQIDLESDLDAVFTPYLQTEHPRLFLNRLTALNIREKGAHLIQPKVERMLAAFGLTPLAPLFDERVIELSFQIPARLKLYRGVEKRVLKLAYQDDLPREVIERPKSGMRVPVHYWFRSEMRRYARRILRPQSLKQAGLFEPERVKQLLAYDIEEGRGRYGLRLWMLITLELWRRIVIDGESV